MPKGQIPWTKGKGKAQQWLKDHLEYPHDYCLIWPFCTDGRVGRGLMGVNGKRGWAHRFMCELAHGPAPEGKPQAAHSCGNGHKGCVNPRHLSWKNNSENQLDRSRHGRGRIYGKSLGFTPATIAVIRSKYPRMTQMQIADEYECSLGTIQYYLKYRDLRSKKSALTNGERL